MSLKSGCELRGCEVLRLILDIVILGRNCPLNIITFNFTNNSKLNSKHHRHLSSVKLTPKQCTQE